MGVLELGFRFRTLETSETLIPNSKKFAAHVACGCPGTRYRQMLFSTPGLSQYISGVIVYDETLRSNCVEGMAPVRHLQAQGIVVGIKVDKGLTVIPGTESENSTQGLDGLGDRCAEYYRMGARFAKWRAIYRISATTPSERAVQENSWALARYGAILPNGLVPIIELVLFIYLFIHSFIHCVFWLGTAPSARRMVWSP